MTSDDRPALTITGPLLVFGGPYSNLQATTALLAEARRLGFTPDQMLCTGDLAAYCANAADVIELVKDCGCLVIAGNCDENLGAAAADCGCGFVEGSACERASAAWFAHASSQISLEQRTWLAGLPRRIDLEIAGRRLAVMHGAPSRINKFVFASTPALIKRRELDLTGVDGLITGHCGLPFSQIIDGRLWHDAGAIGMPANDGSCEVWYSILTPDGDRGLDIEHRRLSYDWAAAAAAMATAYLPTDYADALGTGLWPSCDVLPAREIAFRGQHLSAGRCHWPSGRVRRGGDRRGSVDVTELWPTLGPAAPPLDRVKFQDPQWTAKGEARAAVALERLDTLWFNTGTLCNITCRNCYIESSPRNDRLAYLTAGDVTPYLDEVETRRLGTREIGFTGGEPFLNPEIVALLEICLSRGYETLVLTNAMLPMMRRKQALLRLRERYGDRLKVRVSLDHFTCDRHEEERGPDTFEPTLAGLAWLVRSGFHVSVAGRTMWFEDQQAERAGYHNLFDAHQIPIEAWDPSRLVLFPEMDARADVPEITTACWSILGKSPGDLMCASSRMVVKRKGAARSSVVACTLLPYEPAFELGRTLAEAAGPVPLNHPHCARFCVLGGGSCTAKAGSVDDGAGAVSSNLVVPAL